MANQIVVGNNLISYNQSGTGERIVIFLHGWRSQKEVWSGVVSRIKDERLRIVTIDLPGFGQSPVPQNSWTVGDYAEIVKGFIEKLGLKNVVIVGHSFGGRVGIKLAATYPSIISKLVLVDSAGFATNSAKKSAMGIVSKIVRPFFRPKFMQGLRKSIYKIIGSEDYVATPNLQQTFINTVNEDLSVDMEKISCPTLIITGENDKDTPVEYGQRMQSLINSTPSSDGVALSNDRAKFIILPGAGHFSFLDQPEEFTKIFNEFM